MKRFRPPWYALVAALLVGSLVGIGSYTFFYAGGVSYFGTDSANCANCHIMQPQYDSWVKSSHAAVANCVDCHLPHSLVPKYIAKADNGWRHSWAFTFQNFHEPIQIIERNKRTLQANCIECHGELAHSLIGANEEDAPSCVRCHKTVGHGPYLR